MLVTNQNGNSVSLWKAADLTTLGSFATGASTFPLGACSDGVNFWITLQAPFALARFGFRPRLYFFGSDGAGAGEPSAFQVSRR